MNALFSTIFFISAGTILDTKFKLHKYDKENYRILFDLKNNESGNPFCIKHVTEEYIKKLIQKLEPKILIYQTGSIKKIIESCDVMINIHVELMPSTVLLEGLILKKPIINMTMVDEFLEFQYVKDNAVLSISDQSDLVKPINDLLYDKEFSEKLIKNGQNYVRKFLANPGNASKSLADVLNSF